MKDTLRVVVPAPQNALESVVDALIYRAIIQKLYDERAFPLQRYPRKVSLSASEEADVWERMAGLVIPEDMNVVAFEIEVEREARAA